MTSRTLLKTLSVVLLVMLSVPRMSRAQLLKPDSEGLSMGLVLLNVTDIQAHKKFWMTEFDAKPVKVGALEGVSIPGFVILFRVQQRTGPAEGETINHMGLKLRKLADFTARFDRDG